MGKNVIVSEETLRDLLEAHASLSAWYYELSAALRAAGAVVTTPDDAKRAAFVQRLATDFPEVASVVRTITVPRMYVPPPSSVSQLEPNPSREAATYIEPAAARRRESASSPLVDSPALVPPAVVPPAVDPPALVPPAVVPPAATPPAALPEVPALVDRSKLTF